MILCKKVEETIYKQRNDSKNFNTEDCSSNSKADDYISLQMTINKYKDLTTEIKSKMERFYNLRRIENMENEVKLKKENLQKLKSENSVLNNIYKNQNKAKNEFEEKFENKQQMKILIEKFQNLKEEYRYSKDLQKNSEASLKKLDLKILAVEEKNKKIRDVIELKKKFENLQEKLEDGEDFSKLEDRIKFLEIQVNAEEKKNKSEITKQTSAISKLTDEMAMLNLDIKEKEQQIKINELKLKETKKIKNLTNNLMKKANEKEQPNKKNERAISANFKIPIQNEMKLMSITPINLRQNRSKPFEIEKQKFDVGKMNNNYSSNSNNNLHQYYNVYTNYNNYNNRKSTNVAKIKNHSETSNLSMVSQIEKLSKL